MNFGPKFAKPSFARDAVTGCRDARKQKRFGVVYGVCLLASVVGGKDAISQEYMFEHKLEAVGTPSSHSAKVKFTLTNRGKDVVRVLTWNTPLSGSIQTRMFMVACKVNGRELPVPYEGPLRSASEIPERAPGKIDTNEMLKDPVWLRSGEGRDRIVDLATTYKLPATGECTVTFRGLIQVLEELENGINTDPKLAFLQSKGAPLVLTLKD